MDKRCVDNMLNYPCALALPMALQASRGFNVGKNRTQVLMYPIERLNTVMYIDFAKDVVEVRLNGVFTNKQLFGNLLI